MLKTYISIQPEYVNKFQCDGNACEAMCCQNWHIAIDAIAVKKYKNLANVDLRSQILSSLRTSEETGLSKINLNEKNRCPLLCNDNLCTIHRKLGEEYLSNICATYPRHIKEINGYFIQNLDLSCPIAAKLALLNENQMIFEQVTLTDIRPVSSKLNTKKAALTRPLAKYFIDIQMFILNILQNRQFTMKERLFIIGSFLEKVDELQNSNQTKKILQLIASHTASVNTREILKFISLPPADINENLKQNIFLLNHLRHVSHPQEIKKYIDILVNTLGLSNENKIDKIQRRYQEIDELYCAPYLKKYNYIIENYLINHVFQNLFPFSIAGTTGQNFTLFIALFSLMKFLFVGLAAQRKEALCPEDFLYLIIDFERLKSTGTYIKSLTETLITQEKNYHYYLLTY